MLSYIVNDIKNAFCYIPESVMAAIACVFIVCICKMRPSRKDMIRVSVQTFALVFYVLIILDIAIFSRLTSSHVEVEVTLSRLWTSSARSNAYVIENILFFIPFGCILPFVFDKMRNVLLATGTGLLFSVGLEAVQYVTRRGFVQFSDVLMNTLGTLIGWLVFFTISRLIKAVKK